MLFNKYSTKCSKYISNNMCASDIQIKNSSIIDKIYNTIKSTDIKYNYISTTPRIILKTNKLKTPHIYQLLKKFTMTRKNKFIN